jgi:hypothetical protein
MTRHFDFQLRQPKGPVKPIGHICIRIHITEDDGTPILIDDIKSEKGIDTNINMLIQELETIRKQAKRQFKKQMNISDNINNES